MPAGHEQGNTGLEAVREEAALLRNLQARQQILLKRQRTFDKGVASLRQRYHHQQAQHANGDLRFPPRWTPPLADGTDGALVIVALTEGRDTRTNRPIEQLTLRFKTPHQHSSDSLGEVFRLQDVTIGERYEGLDTFLPWENFDNDDVQLGLDLLDEVRQAQADGKLPHLRKDLAEIGPEEV